MVTKKNLGLHAPLHLELKSCYRQYQLLHRLCRDHRHHLLRLELTRHPRTRPTTGRKALWMWLARLAQAFNQILSQMSPQ